MNVKFKRFIIFFCICGLFTYSLRPQPVYAVFGADDAVVGTVAGVTITSGMVEVMLGSLAVAGGALIYANTDSATIKDIGSAMVSGGMVVKSFGVQTLDTGQKVLTWTKDGLDWVGQKISDLMGKGSVSTPVGSLTLTYSPQLIDTLKKATSTTYISAPVTFPARAIVKCRVDGAIGYSTFIIGSDTYTRQAEIRWLSRGAVGISLGPISTQFVDSSGNVASIEDLTINGQSVCVDQPISDNFKKYNQQTASDVVGGSATSGTGSISYYPKVGIPIAPTGSSASDGTPIYQPTIDVPYGKSLPDVGTIPIPKVGDTTGDTTAPDTTGEQTGDKTFKIPILGDILDILRKILEFLKTLVSTLIDALKTLLCDVFVPSDTLFPDFFGDLQNRIKAKFPYSINILNSLAVGADEFNDITINWYGTTCVIVSASFIKSNIGFIRGATSCFWIFCLIVYVWRKINGVLGGGGTDKTQIIDVGRIGR